MVRREKYKWVSKPSCISPENLHAIEKISSLAIQALKAIGKDQVKPEERTKIISLFQKEEPHRLEHDMRLAPEWIREIIRESVSKRKEG